MADREHDGPRITAVGVGRVERDPDVARATFTVEATRETAAEARGVAAASADRVIAALQGAGITAGDLHTTAIDLTPAWEHTDGRPLRVGFTVTTRLGVAIRDLDSVGRVIDAALEAGATGLDGVGFGLADPAPAASEARRMAVLDARARATTIAEAAGGRLGRLVEVVEGEPAGPVPYPGAGVMLRTAAEAPTPVLPGRVEVTVTVVASWSLD